MPKHEPTPKHVNNLEQAYEAIADAWKGPGVMQWLRLERVLVEILRSDLPDAQKVGLTKEAIDAFTGRGHFSVREYVGSKTEGTT